MPEKIPVKGYKNCTGTRETLNEDAWMADLSPEVLVIDELAGGEIAPVAGPA